MRVFTTLLVAAEMDRKEGRHKYIFTLLLSDEISKTGNGCNGDQKSWDGGSGWTLETSLASVIGWDGKTQFPTTIYLDSVIGRNAQNWKRMFLYPSSIGYIFLPNIAKQMNRSSKFKKKNRIS